MLVKINFIHLSVIKKDSLHSNIKKDLCRMCGFPIEIPADKKKTKKTTNILSYMHKNIRFDHGKVKIGKCCVHKIREKHIRAYRNRKNNKQPKHIINIVEWNDVKNCPYYNDAGLPQIYSIDTNRNLNGTFKKKEDPIEQGGKENLTNTIEASPIEEIAGIPTTDDGEVPLIVDHPPLYAAEETNLFPIRQSDRKSKSAVLREKQDVLKQCIRSKKDDGLRIEDFGLKGRGIVTTRVFNKEDFVIEYIGELMDAASARAKEERYADDPSKGSYSYYFDYDGQNWCIDATEESLYMGRLVNHSRRNRNIIPKTIEVDGLPHLYFQAMRDIEEGEELLYDYGDRSKEALEHCPWLAF